MTRPRYRAQSSPRSRRALGLFAVLLAGCSGSSAGVVQLGNLGFSVQCDNGPCEWQVLSGAPRFGGTWNDGDPGVDLSGSASATIEQRTTFEPVGERDYVLTATVLRDAPVDVTFELHWYRAKLGVTDFWNTAPAPELLRVDRVPVTAVGLTRFRGPSSVPSEAGALALRIVREGGTGRCWVDELLYRSVTAESRGAVPAAAGAR